MKHILIILLMAIPVLGKSQTAGEVTVSLQEAIDLGLKNRYDVQANEYDIAIAGNAVRKSRKEWLPDISGSGNAHYNTQLQATYIPAGFAGSSDPSLLALGAHNATILGLDLNQVIYRPGLTADIKLAKNNTALQQEKKRAKETEIRAQINLSYFDVLLKALQYQIAVKDEDRFNAYYALATGKFNNGALIENDYLHVKLDYENAKVQSATARQRYGLATDNLKYQMNSPVTTILILSDTLLAMQHFPDTLAAADAVANRTEMKQLLLEQKGNELQLGKMQRSALPSVRAFANYSRQYLYDNLDYSQSKWWTPFSYVGITFSIPVTAHIRNQNDIKESRFKIQQTDLRMQQQNSDISYEVQKAKVELSNAAHNMDVAQKNYTLSGTIYLNQQQQYNLGVFLYNNLLDTERSLSAAEQNYISAAYDFLLAKFNYAKATGTL